MHLCDSKSTYINSYICENQPVPGSRGSRGAPFFPGKCHDDVGQGTQTCPGHMVTFAHGNNEPVDMQGLFKPHRLGINVEESNEENLT